MKEIRYIVANHYLIICAWEDGYFVDSQFISTEKADKVMEVLKLGGVTEEQITRR